MDVSTYQVAVNNAKGGGSSVNIPPDLIDKIGRIESSIFNINYNFYDNFLNYDYIDLPRTTAIKKEEGFTVKDYYQSYRKSLNYNNNFKISDFDSVNIIQQNGKMTSTGRAGTYISEPIDISNAKNLGIVVNKIDEYFIGGINEISPSISNANSGYLKFEDKDGGVWEIALYFSNKTTTTSFIVYATRTFTDSNGLVITKSINKQIPITKPVGYSVYSPTTYNPVPYHYLNAGLDYDISSNSKEVNVYVGKGTSCVYNIYNYSSSSSYYQSITTNSYNKRVTFSYSSNNSDCVLAFVDSYDSSQNSMEYGVLSRTSGICYSQLSQSSLGKSIEVGDSLVSLSGGDQLYQRMTSNVSTIGNYGRDYYEPYLKICCKYRDSTGAFRYLNTSMRSKDWTPYFDIKKIDSDKFICSSINNLAQLTLTVFQINTYDADIKTMTKITEKTIEWNNNPITGVSMSDRLSALGLSSTVYFCDELKYDGVNKHIFHEDYLYLISAINRTNVSKDRILVVRYKYKFVDGVISIEEFDENKDMKTFKIKDNFSYMNFARKSTDSYNVNTSLNTSSRECNYKKSNYIIENGYIKLVFTMIDKYNNKHYLLYKAIALDLTSASDDYVIHDSLITGSEIAVYSNVVVNKIQNKINVHLSYTRSAEDSYSCINKTTEVGTVTSGSEWKYKVNQNEEWKSLNDIDFNITNTDNYNRLYLRCDFSSYFDDVHTKIESVDIDIVDEESSIITNEIVTKTIPNISRSGSFTVSSNSLANDGSISWKVTYDGGITWYDINLGKNVEYNFTYVPDLRIKAVMTYDRNLNLTPPNIKDYSFIHSSILPYTDVDRILNLTSEYQELKTRVEKLELKDVVEEPTF